MSQFRDIIPIYEPEVDNPTHYHVKAVLEDGFLPEKIVDTIDEARTAYRRLTDYVIETTKCGPGYHGGRRVIFNNGTSVRWYPCDKNCRTRMLIS